MTGSRVWDEADRIVVGDGRHEATRQALRQAVARGRELDAMEKRLRDRAAYILARVDTGHEYGKGVSDSWHDVLNTLDRPGDTNAEAAP